MSENIINNNALASLAQRAAPHVLQAIKSASVKTGVNFAYLVEQAAAESSFDEEAKSASSSATGLYQFIESTWLNMVKKYGHKHGLGAMANKIGENGKVGDPAVRRTILDLRKDADKAALFAAEFAAENKAYLKRHVGGDIGSTELYFAHFLGAGGAAGFLNAMKENAMDTAADLFPKAAQANRNVFYDSKTGEARTLAGVYDYFAKKFGHGGNIEVPGKPTYAAEQKSYSPVRSTADLRIVTRAQDIDAGFMQGQLLRVLGGNAGVASSSAQWQNISSLSRGSLTFNPVDVMLMAQAHMTTSDR